MCKTILAGYLTIISCLINYAECGPVQYGNNYQIPKLPISDILRSSNSKSIYSEVNDVPKSSQGVFDHAQIANIQDEDVDYRNYYNYLPYFLPGAPPNFGNINPPLENNDLPSYFNPGNSFPIIPSTPTIDANIPSSSIFNSLAAPNFETTDISSMFEDVYQNPLPSFPVSPIKYNISSIIKNLILEARQNPDNIYDAKTMTSVYNLKPSGKSTSEIQTFEDNNYAPRISGLPYISPYSSTNTPSYINQRHQSLPYYAPQNRLTYINNRPTIASNINRSRPTFDDIISNHIYSILHQLLERYTNPKVGIADVTYKLTQGQPLTANEISDDFQFGKPVRVST